MIFAQKRLNLSAGKSILIDYRHLKNDINLQINKIIPLEIGISATPIFDEFNAFISFPNTLSPVLSDTNDSYTDESRLILERFGNPKFHLYIEKSATMSDMKNVKLQVSILPSGDVEFSGSKLIKIITEGRDKNTLYSDPLRIPGYFSENLKSIFNKYGDGNRSESLLAKANLSLETAQTFSKYLIGKEVRDELNNIIFRLKNLIIELDSGTGGSLDAEVFSELDSFKDYDYFEDISKLICTGNTLPPFKIADCIDCGSQAKAISSKKNPGVTTHSVKCNFCENRLDIRHRSKNKLNAIRNWNIQNKMSLKDIDTDLFKIKSLSQVEKFSKLKKISRLLDDMRSQLNSSIDKPSPKYQAWLKDKTYKVMYLIDYLAILRAAIKSQA